MLMQTAVGHQGHEKSWLAASVNPRWVKDADREQSFAPTVVPHMALC